MNKVVVITGGSSGIGKELASLYRNSGDKVYNLSKSIEKETDFDFAVDVCNEESVKNCIDKIAQQNSSIDIVINCAGYGLAGALELTPLIDAKKQFDTNFFGTFLVNKYSIPYMKTGSTILNLSSACALFPLPYRGLYSASKSAVNLYSESLAMELKSSNIKVVAICPGDTKTNFVKNRIKVFETNERYGDSIQNSINKVDGNQEKRMTAEFVAKKIFNISKKKNPKPMYIVGAKYKFLYFLSRIMPKKVMLHFTNKMFGQKKNNK